MRNFRDFILCLFFLPLVSLVAQSVVAYECPGALNLAKAQDGSLYYESNPGTPIVVSKAVGVARAEMVLPYRDEQRFFYFMKRNSSIGPGAISVRRVYHLVDYSTMEPDEIELFNNVRRISFVHSLDRYQDFHKSERGTNSQLESAFHVQYPGGFGASSYSSSSKRRVLALKGRAEDDYTIFKNMILRYTGIAPSGTCIPITIFRDTESSTSLASITSDLDLEVIELDPERGVPRTRVRAHLSFE